MRAILKQYMTLVDFLGKTLGPDHEVILYDLTDARRAVIAISNNHISGRQVGDALPDAALLRDAEGRQYRLHSKDLSVPGKNLRCSVCYIRDGDELVGLLCINFDDSRYQDISHLLFELCHPDAFISAGFVPENDPSHTTFSAVSPESLADAPEEMAADAIRRELAIRNIRPDRLTPEERLRIVSGLQAQGVFSLKGSVKAAAEALHCSPASVYRYLSTGKKT